jgi:hypothetical protein
LNERKSDQDNLKKAKNDEEAERREAEEWANGANARTAARLKVM